MPEIRLNKPLYEEKDSAATQAPRQREPRAPRPNTLARLGAIIVDILLLHFVMLALIRLAPMQVAALGHGGLWLGLLVGWLYFGLGSSELTRGQTLGKLIMQLRVVDVTGPELPVQRGLARAAILMAPLPLVALSSVALEALDRPNAFTAWPILAISLRAIALGWYLGNFFFIALEPHGRSWYDRLIGSVVITTDCDPAALGEFMRSAREPLPAEKLRRPHIFLWATVAAFGVFVTFLGFQQYRDFLRRPPEERERVLAQKQALYIEGFGQPVPLGPTSTNDSTAQDTQTSGAHFQYRRYGIFKAEELRANPKAQQAAEAVAKSAAAEIEHSLIQAKNDMPPNIPPNVRFDVGFAMQCDLFFAWDAIEVFRVSHTLDLAPIIERARKARSTQSAYAAPHHTPTAETEYLTTQSAIGTPHTNASTTTSGVEDPSTQNTGM